MWRVCLRVRPTFLLHATQYVAKATFYGKIHDGPVAAPKKCVLNGRALE